MKHNRTFGRWRRRELTLSLRVCLSSVHRAWGLCVVNAWMMICQGVRTRFLVYDDEWATLPPHAMFSISRLSLWLPAAQTPPSPDCTASQVNCNSKSRSSERSSFCAHKHTCASEPKKKPAPVVGRSRRRGLYTAVKVFMAFRWTKSEKEVQRERDPPPKVNFEEQGNEITQVVCWGMPDKWTEKTK